MRRYWDKFLDALAGDDDVAMDAPEHGDDPDDAPEDWNEDKNRRDDDDLGGGPGEDCRGWGDLQEPRDPDDPDDEEEDDLYVDDQDGDDD